MSLYLNPDAPTGDALGNARSRLDSRSRSSSSSSSSSGGGATSGSAPSRADTPMVYLGKETYTSPFRSNFSPASTRNPGLTRQFQLDPRGSAAVGGGQQRGYALPRKTEIEDIRSVDEAMMIPADWDQEDWEKWADWLVQVGAIDPEDATDTQLLLKMWQESVDQAAWFKSAGRNVTPHEAAAWMTNTANVGGSGAAATAEGANRQALGEGDDLFTGKKVRRVKTVNLTDAATAEAIVDAQVSRMLGRAATQAEIDEFIEALNARERGNPSVTKIVDRYRAGELKSTEQSTEQGGVSDAEAEDLATDDIENLPEYGAVQASTTYYDAFLAGIGAVA